MELELNNESNTFNSLRLVETKPAKKLKLVEIKIDSQNILRKRVELTPTMCDSPRCDFDIAIANGYASYNEVPAATLPALLEAMKQHKEVVHSLQTQDIVDEAELDKITGDKWLGQFKTF